MYKNKLSIGFVSSILHPKYGGPVSVIKSHLDFLAPIINIIVFGIAEEIDNKAIKVIFPNVILFKKTFPKKWFTGKLLFRSLKLYSHKVDLYHVHMLWDFPLYAVWRVSATFNKPFIVTPHASLLGDWRINKWYKKIYFKIILLKILKASSFIHVLNHEEAKFYIKNNLATKVRVIPNGLPNNSFGIKKNDSALKIWPILQKKRIVLYLGRIWSEKGLELLVDSWKNFNRNGNDDWLLVLSGPDYRGYKSVIEKKINDSIVKNSVLFTGFVDGELKQSLLSISEIFILLSKGEGFSMAILEAMAASLPVIYTKECHFPELAHFGGGWIVNSNKTSVLKTLNAATKMNKKDLNKIGKNGLLLARKKYSQEVISKQLMQMYQDAL